MPRARDTGRGAERRQRHSDALEMVVSVGSALLILLLAGYIAWEGRRADELPAFVVRTGEIRASGGAYHIPVVVENTGGRTAQDVTVRVEPAAPGAAPGGGAELTLEWIPARSRRAGTVILREDPRPRGVTARVVSYEEP
jgi:uncharacterized protein (TIGR02588 family)